MSSVLQNIRKVLKVSNTSFLMYFWTSIFLC
jgi:hypothetical protein